MNVTTDGERGVRHSSRSRRRLATSVSRHAVAAAVAFLLFATAGLLAQRRDYPNRPPADPAAVERGKALYGVNCQFCHGADTRGGDSGPSLLRSGIVLDDQHGELIAPVVRAGRPGMPKFTLTDDQIADVAAFVHTFRAAGYDESRVKPPSIVVGDAKAGETFFAAKCGVVPFADRRSARHRDEDRPIRACCSRPGCCRAAARDAAVRRRCR